MNIRTNAGETLWMEPGCYVDGINGQYVYDELAAMATLILGVADYETMAKEARYSDDFDALAEVADEALEALNDATTGGVWAWEDGEVFLTENED